MKIHPFVLESALPPEECIERLRTGIAESGMGFFTMGDFGDGGKQFHGKIEGDAIELRKRKLWFWRNDFAPHLFAKLTPGPSGTRIEGYFGVGSRVSGFMKFWVVLVLLMGGATFVSTGLGLLRGQHSAAPADPAALIVFPAMLAFGFLLPRIGYYFTFWHERELMDFAVEVFAARKSEISYPAATFV